MLHVAASNGQKRIVKQLLREATGGDSKLDVYACNYAGQNAIQCALQFRYKELAEYLASKLPSLQPAGVSAGGGGCGEGGARVARKALGMEALDSLAHEKAADDMRAHQKAACPGEGVAYQIMSNHALMALHGGTGLATTACDKRGGESSSSVAGAAMLIQRAFRCHSARLCYYLLLGIEDGAYEEEAVERTAATIIQQAYRAFLARSYYFELLAAAPSSPAAPACAASPSALPPGGRSAPAHVLHVLRAASNASLAAPPTQSQEEEEEGCWVATDSEEEAEVWTAATTIQQAFRCYLARALYYELEALEELQVLEMDDELQVLDMDDAPNLDHHHLPTGVQNEEAGSEAAGVGSAQEEELFKLRTQAWSDKTVEEQAGVAAAAPARQRTLHVSERSAKEKVTGTRTFRPWR